MLSQEPAEEAGPRLSLKLNPSLAPCTQPANPTQSRLPFARPRHCANRTDSFRGPCVRLSLASRGLLGSGKSLRIETRLQISQNFSHVHFRVQLLGIYAAARCHQFNPVIPGLVCLASAPVVPLYRCSAAGSPTFLAELCCLQLPPAASSTTNRTTCTTNVLRLEPRARDHRRIPP